ncbi:nicotinate-nucleotide--dimethylbenzimidazole phosphoribosyltransferase [Streptomyces camelliae]|uniref:Nicotinate-nucleotide--dimethylbenzimidazole phosphoribosyltransferase n=1 Tax=Streptomyces camelliae TaxID=3004093 RepID=A0ABY7PA76_9ACTN|nr:nicotinate-nucleotide--dimethylbenzimidazole phosphoribosyltransferase [Streptomyces sp. HUAS 2-6]WBO67475.1 nicotinate-nucleotide--dimethylbenzimidazole phosphoribosyltransferase [Streptomyces sp. HUAS 2-6]
MTDTGQVPGEGQPESAGMVEQPGVAAHGAYTYLSEAPAEDEDLLLPGAQGAWGNEVPPPAPEPVVEAVHEPGPHETAGRDSGSVDLSGVRLPNPAPASVPPSPILSAPQDVSAAPQPPRRPLHLGPPIPDASASPVRSLADRGPAGAPVRQPAPAPAGPEYLDAQPLHDMAPQNAAPWGTAPTPAPAVAVAEADGQTPAAETVDPAAAGIAVPADAPAPAEALVPAQATAQADPSGAAQAAVARLAHQAAVPAPGTAAQVVHGHDGVQPVHGHDGVYAATGAGPEGVAAAPFAAEQGAEGADDAPVVPQPAAGDGQGAPTEQPVEGAVAEQPVEQPLAGAVAVGGAAGDGAPVAETPAVTEPEAGPVVSEGAPVVAEGTPVVAEEADVAAPGQEAQASPAEPAAVVEEAQAAALPGETAPPQAPEAAQGADVAVAEPSESAQPSEAAGPGQGESLPQSQTVPVAADADQAAPVAEGAVTVDDAERTVAAVPAPQAPDAAQTAPEALAAEAAPEAVAVLAEPAAPGQQPAPATPATAEPQAAVVDAQSGVVEPAVMEAQPAAAQPAPAAEAVPAPEPTALPEPPALPEAVAPAPEPEAAEAEASAVAPAQEAVPAPAVVETVATPEPHLHLAQGPQLAEPVAPAAPVAEALPGTPEAQAAAAPQTQPEPTAAPEGAPAGPQTQPTDATPPPAAPAGDAAEQQAAAQAEPLPSHVPLEPQPEQPLGQFVPVEGQVPTTPHLAPTPPQPLVLPTEETQAPVAAVPAPREGDQAADVVQHAEDLQTRAADQEEQDEGSTAAVAEARQSTGPAAPAYADAEREAVLKVMRERRDIRNGFRSDPIPHEVLLRVLEAAHTAPSVGHSQPWDFVVIRSAETRRTMHELAMRQREAYAKSLPKGRAKQFKELKIEAILDTPVNIVVTADPTRGGRHTLGRYTQPQMAPYSSALAVENLWLAARAEGLGVGWVSFFDEREMVRALGLPEHLEVVAYLCVGYVDEFPDEPELMQAGWSKRRPLSWVVHEETYGRRALPGEEPHDLLAETVAQIRPLDAKALGEAWERQKRMTKPAGALGMLEIISAQLSGLSRQCPPPIPEPAAVAIFAGDHGVHAQGVTPWPQEVTAQMVANFLGGGAVCNAFAAQVGAEVCVVDVGVAADLPATPGLLPRKVRAGTSDMTTGPAMTREEAKQAIEVGIETARDLVAAGNKALLTGEMGIANTTASAALISVYTGADPAEVTGRGTGINDETLARKTEVVRRALEFHQPDPADPLGVLAAIGGFEHAAMVGLLLGGASLRTPVILDGVSAGAAALVARAIAPEVLAACIAGHRSAEPGHVAALNKLGLRPLVDLDLRLGEGTGALLALPLVQSTARAMHEVATFDSAGVTEK